MLIISFHRIGDSTEADTLLPYFSDIMWTIAREGEEKQVGEIKTTTLERKQMVHTLP